MTGEVRVLGIRHHGPGSARSLLRVLDDWRPDAVLIELPADCGPSLPWLGDAELVPPVALLGYVLDEPRRAVFLPLTTFSPEWCAARWALGAGAALEAIDLPLAQVLARDGGHEIDGDDAVDPLAALAAAVGEPDAERWWDDVVEHRGDGQPAFDAIAEAMSAVRSVAPPPSELTARREAHLRRGIRRALTAGHRRIAVMCGAWHVPALAPLSAHPAATDATMLRGATRVRVGVSWVPWTDRRLAAATGYRAGVASPAWYRHVFTHPGEEGIARWLVDAARLLRSHDLMASPDHLIAATRASTTLAALRGRPRPGLDEVLDAAESVMAAGTAIQMLRDDLVIGHRIGRVPDAAPQVPLARDLAASRRRVRLRPEATLRTLELDLRTPSGRARSILLHRTRALGVPWGVVAEGRGTSGTFRETWRLSWEPEQEIRVIELAGHGTTVASAAASRLAERAAVATGIAELVDVLRIGLLADLPSAIAPVLDRIADAAGHDAHVAQVMDVLGPLAGAARYGDVRGSDAASLRDVVDDLVVRVLAGAVDACRSLAADEAAAMAERLASVHAALSLLDHPSRGERWPAVLAGLVERNDVNSLLQGRAARLLHDSGAWSHDRIERRLARALSIGIAPADGAAFVEGFLAGSGTVLIHDRELLGIVDRWVSSLTAITFIDTVPLLRRTFGAFELGERRQLGQLLAGTRPATAWAFGDEIDDERAAAALRTVRTLLAPSAER